MGLDRGKNTVFSLAGRKSGKCGNLLSRQGSPLPGRTRFLAAFFGEPVEKPSVFASFVWVLGRAVAKIMTARGTLMLFGAPGCQA